MTTVIRAFLRKDLLVETSYRLSFALGTLSSLTGMAIFYFIDKLFGRTFNPYLEGYGAGYFEYVFAASAFFGYIGTGAGSYSARLRDEQVHGTLDATLSSPVSPTVFLLSLTAWNFLFATFELAVCVAAGVLVFGLDLSRAGLPALAAVFLLSAVSFASLGVLSSCFVLLFKRGNPAAWLLNNFEGLLGGVYFPVAVLPSWLQWLSGALPITYAVRALQPALYRGAGVGELLPELLALLAFALVLAPLSVAAFTAALRKARKDGSLGQY